MDMPRWFRSRAMARSRSLRPSAIQRSNRDDVTVQVQVIAFYKLSENRPQVPAADAWVVSACCLHDDFAYDIAKSMATAVNRVRGWLIHHKNDSCLRDGADALKAQRPPSCQHKVPNLSL